MSRHSHSAFSQLKVVNWGRTDYTEALERQLKLVELRKADEINNHLIFTEHPPTFTIGKRSNAQNNLLWDLSKCAQEGISVIQTNRGGDITYHGPANWYATRSYHSKDGLTCTNTFEIWNQS